MGRSSIGFYEPTFGYISAKPLRADHRQSFYQIRLRMKKTMTSVRRPHCNGQAEHFNRALVKMLNSYLNNL
ncbi:hypothetical protein MAR_017698 [Mya arenaria]|uniref:Integrase catalytic domain-containing protein n=1 Tax=Mya arenaria TaxID=6604 RepID=A0ABY7ECZ5_MYAAR|nr:hypothetical protein MAR_017698 [Mya arenaria]